jgi:hypothetical protein
MDLRYLKRCEGAGSGRERCRGPAPGRVRPRARLPALRSVAAEHTRLAAGWGPLRRPDARESLAACAPLAYATG